MIGEIDDLSVLSSRAEIVKKPSNLPQVQVQLMYSSIQVSFWS